MSAASIPVNEWVSIPESWPIVKYPEARQNWRQFIFHSIRPVSYKVILAECSGDERNRNELRIIEPLQTSLILGYRTGFFVCVSVTSRLLEKRRTRLAREYEILRNLGQAGLWFLAVNNLFQGPWQVFNGPNSIDLTAP